MIVSLAIIKLLLKMIGAIGGMWFLLLNVSGLSIGGKNNVYCK